MDEPLVMTTVKVEKLPWTQAAAGVPGLELGGEAPLGTATPPPIIPTDYQGHYVNVLDAIREEFEDPDSRTKERMRVLIVEVINSLSEVVQRALVEVQEALDKGLIEQAVADQWKQEFMRTGLRFREVYYPVLVPDGIEPSNMDEWGDIDPKSTDTDVVYEGMITGRSADDPDGYGALVVPDVLAALYLADQIDVIDDHVEELSDDFLTRTLLRLPNWVAETAVEVEEEIKKEKEEAKDWWAEHWTKVVAGTGVGLGAIGVGVVILVNRKRKRMERMWYRARAGDPDAARFYDGGM